MCTFKLSSKEVVIVKQINVVIIFQKLSKTIEFLIASLDQIVEENYKQDYYNA